MVTFFCSCQNKASHLAHKSPTSLTNDYGGLLLSVALQRPHRAIECPLPSSLLRDHACGSSAFQKGAGYHLDLFWVAILMMICSFIGLPWYVAATVISIAHIDSLKMESESSAPGEQPQFLGVRSDPRGALGWPWRHLLTPLTDCCLLSVFQGAKDHWHPGVCADWSFHLFGACSEGVAPSCGSARDCGIISRCAKFRL